MKLKIDYLAAEKIRQFTALCPDEISGLGRVELKGGDLHVVDVDIFKQRVSSAHSTIEPKDLAEFQSDIIKAGGSMKDYTLWWHSHAHMGVFFSKTDTDTIEESTEFPYLVSLVVNKKGEAKARLDVYYPKHMTEDLLIEVENAPKTKEVEDIEYQIEELQELLKETTEKTSEPIKTLCQKEIDEKVTTSRTFFGGKGGRGYGSNWDGSGWEIELRTGYWKDKNQLLRQITALKGKKGMEKILQTRQTELREHVTYGESMGYEDLKLITDGS